MTKQDKPGILLKVKDSAGKPISLGSLPDIPDRLIMEAYERAAAQNILAAVNPEVFFGYFSVCADGIGFGYGNSYPAVDGHQMTDALLWLEQIDVVRANWDYVKKFQRPNGQLPFAILPAEAGKNIGPSDSPAQVDTNGGLYRHWVPGDPLRVSTYTTYIQNADIIFRFTQDREWLAGQLPSVNLAADYLASLTMDDGAVKGAGYYVERPTRVEYDGVSQCHTVDAFHRIAELNAITNNSEASQKYRKLANRIETHFRTRFWLNNRFAEYIHPEYGVISNHGLTDVDWSSIATGTAGAEQQAILWPMLKDEKLFYYGGMPTGIATLPMTYEKWESTYDDSMDLAAMGRVWYIESWARANMRDAHGLLEAVYQVCKAGRDNGYYWRERYNGKGGYGAEKYCEYPANLIRIVQRFMLGVEHGLDGTLYIGPTVPEEFWIAGFGQTLSYRGRQISYKMQNDNIQGEYSGQTFQQLSVRFSKPPREKAVQAAINGSSAAFIIKDDWISIVIPPVSGEANCSFEIQQL
ncbi:MAG: hypothetical protein FIA99_02625 [Ruminiclostridium sp.]|nr:hypothetical protein [Ruminiclostridium sp.]